MKQLFLLSLIAVLVSCGTKDNFDDFTSGKSFSQKSKIDPLFKAKSIAQKYGDGKFVTVKVKVPLTKNTIASYDLSEILEDSTLDSKEAGFFRSFVNKSKLVLYKWGVKLGISSRIKYSTEFDLRDFDISMIKSLKVNKVFFTLEDCPVNDEECIVQDAKKPVTFKFLDTFFLNASILMPHDDKTFMEEIEVEDEEGNFVMTRPNAFKALKRREFKKLSEKAFVNSVKEFDLEAESNSQYYDLTLARVKPKKSDLFKSENEDEYEGNTTLIIKSNPSINDSIAQIKEQLKSKKISALIKDYTLVGENIFVELNENIEQKDFFQVLNLSPERKEDMGIISMDKCTNQKCISLETDHRNLVPMLDKSSLLKFDTYISLKDLELNDFRYNGYVELEVKLDLPL